MSSSYTAEAMAQAVRAVQDGKGIKNSALAWGVPYTSLYTQLKRSQSSKSETTKPVHKFIHQHVPKPVTKPATIPAAKPVTKPVIKPVTKPVLAKPSAYTPEAMAQAVLDVQNGQPMKATAALWGIPYTSLWTFIKKSQKSQPSPTKHVSTPVTKPAPKPVTKTVIKPVTKPVLAKPSAYTSEAMAQAVFDVESGQPMKTSAMVWGVPYSSLYKVVKRSQNPNSHPKKVIRMPARSATPLQTVASTIKPRTHKYTPEDLNNALMEVIANGERTAVVSKKWEIPESTLRTIRDREGKSLFPPVSAESDASLDPPVITSDLKQSTARYTEDDLASALEAIAAGERVMTASRKWGVPESTLRTFRDRQKKSQPPPMPVASDISLDPPATSPFKEAPASSARYTEDDVTNALKAMAKGEKTMVAAKRWGVPESTLRLRRDKPKQDPSPAAPVKPVLAQSTSSLDQPRPKPAPAAPTHSQAFASKPKHSSAKVPRLPNYTEAQVDAALDAVANGAKMKPTAKAMGIPFTAIYKRVLKERRLKLNPGQEEYTEEDINSACEDIAKGAKIWPTSVAYGIPDGFLRREYKRRRRFKITARSHEVQLSVAQERNLAGWTRAQGSLGFPPTVDEVINFAQQILHLSGGSGTLDRNWLEAFARRNPDVVISGLQDEQMEDAGEDEGQGGDDDSLRERDGLTDDTTMVEDNTDDEMGEVGEVGDQLALIRSCVDAVVSDFELSLLEDSYEASTFPVDTSMSLMAGDASQPQWF